MEVFSILRILKKNKKQVLNIKLKYLPSPSSFFILILIIAYDLKLSRKCKNFFPKSFQNTASNILVIIPIFRIKYMFKNLTLKILIFCFHFMYYHLTF